MTNQGYLVTPLGIKSGFQLYGYQLPTEYFKWFDALPENLHLLHEEKLEDIASESLGFAHLFFKEKKVC